MSTEEIVQRTRLLDSEIKVGPGSGAGGEAPTRLSLPTPDTSTFSYRMQEAGAYLLGPEKEKKEN